MGGTEFLLVLLILSLCSCHGGHLETPSPMPYPDVLTDCVERASMTRHLSPRRAHSFARNKPTGPAPTIRTSVSIATFCMISSNYRVHSRNRPIEQIFFREKPGEALAPGTIGYGASASKLSRSSGRVYMSILPSAVRGHSLGGS